MTFRKSQLQDQIHSNIIIINIILLSLQEKPSLSPASSEDVDQRIIIGGAGLFQVPVGPPVVQRVLGFSIERPKRSRVKLSQMLLVGSMWSKQFFSY